MCSCWPACDRCFGADLLAREWLGRRKPVVDAAGWGLAIAVWLYIGAGRLDYALTPPFNATSPYGPPHVPLFVDPEDEVEYDLAGKG